MSESTKGKPTSNITGEIFEDLWNLSSCKKHNRYYEGLFIGLAVKKRQTFQNPRGEHHCIRCGGRAMFLKKYRITRDSPFFPAWLCIECMGAFKPNHYDKKHGMVDYWGKHIV